MALSLAISNWNLLWEAAQFRRRFFDDEELLRPLHKVADQGDVNVVFVLRTESRYHEYAPLLHLLPRVTTVRRLVIDTLTPGDLATYARISHQILEQMDNVSPRHSTRA